MNSLEGLQKTVLVVDDEVELVNMLVDSLNLENINAVGAYDGKSALEKIEKNKPDLIISDFKMPGLDGIEFIKTLRDLNYNIPIILLSGNADKVTFRDAWRLGVFDYFQKPFIFDDVLPQIKECLNADFENKVKNAPFLNKNIHPLNIEIELPLFNEIKKKSLKDSLSISSYIIKICKKDIENSQ